MFWLNVKSRCLPRRVWAFIMKAKGRCAYDRRTNQDGQKGEGRQSGGTCGAAWRCPPDSVQVGERNVSSDADVLIKIAEALDVPVSQLLGIEPESGAFRTWPENLRG